MHSKRRSQENRIRVRADGAGFRLHKSRKRKDVPNLDNFGEYMLVKRDGNFVVLGSRYDATLETIERFLK